MFVASLSRHARAIGVLLGGSGVCQPLPRVTLGVGALLLPRLPRTTQEPSGSASVASVDSLWQASRHD